MVTNLAAYKQNIYLNLKQKTRDKIKNLPTATTTLSDVGSLEEINLMEEEEESK